MKSSNQIQIQQNQQISTVTSLSAKDDLKLHERKGFDPEELIQQMALGSSDSRSNGNWDIQDIHTRHQGPVSGFPTGSQPPSVLVRPRAETLRAAGISLGPAESWAMAHTQSRSLPRWQRICGHQNHGISWDIMGYGAPGHPCESTKNGCTKMSFPMKGLKTIPKDWSLTQVLTMAPSPPQPPAPLFLHLVALTATHRLTLSRRGSRASRTF